MSRIYSRGASAAAVKTIDVHERQRPHILRGSLHVDREATIAREELHPEINAGKWINPTNLDAPDPRPGYVQRWVRDGSLGGDGVSADWTRKMREGWEPRDPSTIPPKQRMMYPSAKSVGGVDVIRIANLVLCEIPKRVAMQRRLGINDIIERQRQSVPTAIQDLRKNASRELRDAISEPRVEESENNYTGRRTATMVD